MKTCLILLSAGSGTRMGLNRNKVFFELSGKSVLRRSLEAFRDMVQEIILVHRPADKALILREVEKAGVTIPVHLVHGGETRQDSVRNGFRHLTWQADDIILIHDSARCLISADLVRRILEKAGQTGAAIPGIPVTNTIKKASPDQIISTVDRSTLYEAQTPQAIRADWLDRALVRAEADHFQGTDDASLLEHCGLPVSLVEGEKRNIKLTSREDIPMAEAFLSNLNLPRIGHGYDVHRFAENRKLILCGVDIPCEKGLLGHSDADVAAHALMDALLGAAALGDIGRLFPDTDPAYKGISSMILLKKVVSLLKENDFEIINADLTIIAQQPKLSPWIGRMVETLSKTMEIDPACLNVKATTTERLGFEGREEGISAHAVCLIRKITPFGRN